MSHQSPTEQDVRPRLERLTSAVLERFTGTPGQLAVAYRQAFAGLADEELTAFERRLRGAGRDWQVSPPDPVARALVRVMASAVLGQTHISGIEHLEAVKDRPRIYMANHLSYSDANVFHSLLELSGQQGEADSLVVMVGPKVFHTVARRVASLAFSTIKTPQSSGKASGAARMSLREVARIAGETVERAREQVLAGKPLLVFAEGMRSRDAAMMDAIPAVARYYDGIDDAVIVPVGIVGTEIFLSVNNDRLAKAPMDVRVGEAIEASELLRLHGKSRKERMDAVGRRIAALLPADYRGVYGHATP